MALPQLQKDFRDADTQDFLSDVNNTNKKSARKYNIDSYKYPLEITNINDLQHYVSFFINVRGKSKFNNKVGINGETQKVLEDVKVGQGQNRIDPNILAQSGGFGSTALGIAGAEVGGLSGLLSGISGGSAKTIVQGAKGVAIGAATGALAGRVLDKLGVTTPDTLKRISDVITLHIQEKPSTNYSVNYREQDMGAIVGAMAGGVSMKDMNEVQNNLGVGEVAGAIATQVLNTVSGKASNVLELGLKQKLNPFKEQFFENVDFRTFSFRHTFMPKSKAEAENVKRILNLFKFHMHPELSKGGLFYIYPSEFEIKYFYRDRENTYFDKISSCVLEDMSVDYGGDIFSTFEDGNPVEVNMTLKFKELEVLTKERIAQGY